MSYDPILNPTQITLHGDINCGKGQLGLTTQTINTSIGVINHLPGSQYSDYYSHYLINISPATIGTFVLADIGTPTGVSIGYNMCIDCVSTGSTAPLDELMITDSSLIPIGRLRTNGKALLLATSAGTWKVSYAVPGGANNSLLVYSGSFGAPKLQYLPIQKEISNSVGVYGIKCLQSFDVTETSLLANLTNYTSLNRLIFEGCTTVNATLSGITGTSPMGFYAACRNTTFLPKNTDSMVVCLGSTGGTITNNTTATATSIGASTCNITTNSTLPSLSTILGSDKCSITSNGPVLCSSMASSTCNINSNGTPLPSETIAAVSANMACVRCNIGTAPTANSAAAFIASKSCSVSINGDTTYAAIACRSTLTGFLNNSSELLCAGSYFPIFAQNTNVGATFNSCGIISSTQSTFDGSQGGRFRNSNLIATNGATILSGTTNDEIDGCIITSSITADINNSSYSSIISTSFGCEIINSSCASIFGGSEVTNITNDILTSCMNCSLSQVIGDGDVTTYSAVTGFANKGAGITMLSSHNSIFDGTTFANDARYCVMGGVGGITWSIDSKTGIHYGSAFNNTQPLPGFAEMFENLVSEIIPYGRLLQLENGKVRTSTNGESGFMISRPYESAAFVAGNPYFEWHKKYITDEFGVVQTETITREQYIERLLADGITQENIDKMTIADTNVVKKLNPDYSKNTVYTPRSSRREQWTTCEKSGIVVVEYSGVVSVGDYLISGANGIAKYTSRRTNIKVLEIISNQYAKVDITNQHVAEMIDITAAITDGIAHNYPLDISIKGISFLDNLIVISEPIQLKLSVEIVSTLPDVCISLIGETTEYDIFATCAKSRNNYKFNGELKDIIAADKYKLVIETADKHATTCKINIKC